MREKHFTKTKETIGIAGILECEPIIFCVTWVGFPHYETIDLIGCLKDSSLSYEGALSWCILYAKRSVGTYWACWNSIKCIRTQKCFVSASSNRWYSELFCWREFKSVIIFSFLWSANINVNIVEKHFRLVVILRLLALSNRGRKEMFYLMKPSTHFDTVLWRRTYG